MPVRTRMSVAMDEAGQQAVQDLQQCILDGMKYANVDEDELASRMSTSRKFVDALLETGSRNLSVLMIGRIFMALGLEVNIWIAPPNIAD